MNVRLVLIIILVLLSGCATPRQVSAISKAAALNRFQGIDDKTTFSVSFPSTHSGPYQSVDLFNFTIEEGDHQGKNSSAILVKPKGTGEWEVFAIFLQQDEKWVKLDTNSAPD